MQDEKRQEEETVEEEISPQEKPGIITAGTQDTTDGEEPGTKSRESEDTADEKKDPEQGETLQDAPQKDKKSKRSAAKPILIVMAVFGIAFFAAMIASMAMSAQAEGYALAASDVVMYLYQYNAVISGVLLLMSIVMLAGGKHKEILARTFSWGVMLGTLVMAAPMFSQLYMLPQVDALTGFNFLVMYIPMLCVVTAYTALNAQWASESRKAAGRLSIIAAAVAAAVTIYYGVNVIDPTAQYVTFQYLQLAGILCADVLMVLACVFAWYICVKEDAFRIVTGTKQVEDEAGK